MNHLTYTRKKEKNQVMTRGATQLATSAGPLPSLMYFMMIVWYSDDQHLQREETLRGPATIDIWGTTTTGVHASTSTHHRYTYIDGVLRLADPI